MKKMSAATALALVSLAPAFGSACEYDAATSASAAPPAPLVAAPAPEASRVPTQTALKAPVPKKTSKQVLAKSQEAPGSDVKVAALTSN